MARLLLFTCILTVTAVVSAEDITVRTRAGLIRAAQNAKPGTRILIRPGTYRGGISLSRLRGELDNPIVLTAADPKRPPIFQGGAACLQLSNPVHVELHNLIFSGATDNGLNIDDGGSYDSPAQHLLLQGLKIRDVAPKGNHDAIKLSGVDNFRVESCLVERWGTGGSGIDMVGCHQGTIINCTFRNNSSGYGNGVQTKGGSSNIHIQHCRFENAGSRAVNMGGSTGPRFFRPKLQGYEAKNIFVEDCTFIGSMAAIAFVGVDGAIVRYNTIYRPDDWVVRILQESRGSEFTPCRGGVFTNNVIAFRADELRTAVNVGPGTAPTTFTFANNYWYCIDAPKRSARLSLPVKETAGSYGIDPQFKDAQNKDFNLKATSSVSNAGVRQPQ